MKTYFLYCDAALSCNYNCSAAAMGKNILLQVTTRAIKGLRKPEGSLVCSFFLYSRPYSSLLFNVCKSNYKRLGTMPSLLNQYCATKSNVFPTILFLELSFLLFCLLTSSGQYAHPFPACRHSEQDLALELKQ